MANKATEKGRLLAKQLRSAEQHNYDETLQRYHDRYTTISTIRRSTRRRIPVLRLRHWPQRDAAPWDVTFKRRLMSSAPKCSKSRATSTAPTARAWMCGSPTGIIRSNRSGRKLELLRRGQFTDDPGRFHRVRKTHFEREMDMSKDPKMYSFCPDSYRIVLSYNPRTILALPAGPFRLERRRHHGQPIPRISSWTKPRSMGTKMIEGFRRRRPVWDGETVPWGQFGQPLRLIRVTYKVSRDQMEAKNPLRTPTSFPTNNLCF